MLDSASLASENDATFPTLEQNHETSLDCCHLVTPRRSLRRGKETLTDTGTTNARPPLFQNERPALDNVRAVDRTLDAHAHEEARKAGLE